MRDADTKLDHLDTALNITLRISQRLTVLARQQLGQLVDMLVDQLDKTHHHPRPALRIERPPLLLRPRRRGHRALALSLAAHRSQPLPLAGIRIKHLSSAGRLPSGSLAINEMRDL